MKKWKVTVGAALIILSMTAAPALAAPVGPGQMETAGDVIPIGISAPATPSAPTSGAGMTLSGKVTHEDLEGGYYAVNGWMLIGDAAVISPWLGREVTVTGIEEKEPTMQMVKAIRFTEIVPAKPGGSSDPVLRPIIARRAMPKVIAVVDRQVKFDRQPIVVDGCLMVPLRAVVEAAGGTVTWSETTRTAGIRLADRNATFYIGEDRAEMNQDGYYYFARNLIKMAHIPVVSGQRILISADALSNILGFNEGEGQEGTLSLVPPTAAATVGSVPPAEGREAAPKTNLVGQITQLETGDQTRILVEGEAPNNGGTTRTWVSVNSDTRITIRENGQDRPGSVADLKVGQSVDVGIDGPILMSDPAQAAGSTIVILP